MECTWRSAPGRADGSVLGQVHQIGLGLDAVVLGGEVLGIVSWWERRGGERFLGGVLGRFLDPHPKG